MKKASLLLSGLLMIISGGLTAAAQSSDARTALEQGVCAFKNKDYRSAQAEFEKALQQDPEDTIHYMLEVMAWAGLLAL